MIRITPSISAHQEILRKLKQRGYQRTKIRRKRAKDVLSHGIVTTDQLAATVQALSERLAYAVRKPFQHAVVSTCQSMKQVYTILRDLIFAEPTRTARTLLNSQNLYARTGPSTIEVFPCSVVDPKKFTFIVMNDTACGNV